jgi:hypothetical protein
MFMRGLGLSSGGRGNNFFVYNEITPLVNAFLNMRYLITFDGYLADDTYWETIGEAGDSLLLENKRYLPLGFMVHENIIGYAHHNENPFFSQNDLFRRATGLNGNLFTITTNDIPGMTAWDYEMSSDGILYAYCRNDKDYRIAILVNGAFYDYIYVIRNTPFISPAGNFMQGDIITFIPENDTLIHIGHFNPKLFEQGYSLLASQPLNLTQFSNTRVSGYVTALRDGVLYTSIPGRNWNVYVTGVKNELLLIDNAMAAVRLSEGTHHVEFRYFNRSLAVGGIISLVSLAIFIIKSRIGRKGNNENKKEA